MLHLITFSDRDARYVKWKMAVQRSLGWATTKKSIAMTGQDSKRKNSIKLRALLQKINFDTSLPNARQNSLEMRHSVIDHNDVNSEVEDLLKYSARKLSIFVPVKTHNTERTIVDDAEYFMNKKECEYGMCECCQGEKKVLPNWESIEELIENDPEIIFDSDDNPIMVEPVRNSSSKL